ncbi:hybrid sensor histidine kinase/response regulator [Flammeovirga pectinis]|uniref:histidine kinase n=1 Tax=Flammeovirga pectinis TaxID=2494373 RepID=A0A3Q9FMW4_9BACT|nr:hybrid sensor histidine kinase/response regulator transcription factor [Flammeovirga pectinis]AZQ61318.1 hybrid sensor histidine kinase/response regulator [Flammeovirga pectinis]
MNTNINIKFIFLLLATLLSSLLFAQQKEIPKFENIKFPQSSNGQLIISDIIQDQNGYMWFGTTIGIFRYDGFEMKEYKMYNNPGQPPVKRVTSMVIEDNNTLWISTNIGVFYYSPTKDIIQKSDIDDVGFIHHLNYTREGNLLIGSVNGLMIYNIESKTSETYTHIKGVEKTLSANLVRCTYLDTKGNLWVGTENKLNRIDAKTKEVKKYKLVDKNHGDLIKNNYILSILPFDENDDETLIVGTETGLCKFNTTTGEYQLLNRNNSNLSNPVIKTICRINEDEIWLGTDRGLTIWYTKTDEFRSFFHDSKLKYSINNNIVTQIIKGQKNNIWIGTENGASKVHLKPSFLHFNKTPTGNTQLESDLDINDIKIAKNNDMWITTNNGLVNYSSKSDTYKTFRYPSILHTKTRSTLIKDNGEVWITSLGGLNIYNEKTDSFDKYVAGSKNVKGLNTNYLNFIQEDVSGDTWITSYLGLLRVKELKNKTLEVTNITQNLGNKPIDTYYSTSPIIIYNKKLWAGNGRGVAVLNSNKGKFQPIQFENQKKFKYHNPKFVLGDSSLWLADNKALYKIEKKKPKWVSNFTENIKSLQITEKQIWIATAHTLYALDRKTKKLHKLTQDDTGIDLYKEGSAKDSNGNIYFTGMAGFVSFNPDEVIFNDDVSEVHLTGLKVKDRNIIPNMGLQNTPILTKDINDTDKIVLDYTNNSFSLKFSTIDYKNNNSSKFFYKLEGIDDDWESISKLHHSATYKKLSPGTYIFKIRASKRYQDQPNKILKIVIRSPWWASTFAIIAYIIFFILAIFLLRKLMMGQMKMQNQLELEKYKREENDQLTQQKITFFTNVSHELRTPLTLIKSPLEFMISEEDDPKKLTMLTRMKNNSDRLGRLVNQVLDLRKIEQGGETLNTHQYDIVQFVKSIQDHFEEASLKRGLQVKFTAPFDHYIQEIDVTKMEKVIYNLYSNAIKFTPDDGKIETSIGLTDQDYSENVQDHLFIKVANTGQGIPKEYLTKIFDRFVNVQLPNYNGQKGTGIGLALVRDYVKLHNGQVTVESTENEWTTFTIFLPIQELKFINKNEIEDHVVVSEVEIDSIITSQPEENNYIEEEQEDEITIEDSRPTLLIVEDDVDMQAFLVELFEDEYHILRANNGADGWKLAKSKLPTIIISDWMMPKMNGAKMTEKIKSDLRTSHIPTILLTAKSGIDSKMEGIEMGADEYIEKPFNVDYLKLRVRKLIEQRTMLRENVKKEAIIKPNEVTINSIDENFLTEVIDIIEKKIDNHEFTVKELCEEVGLSHSNLLKKIKSLTGQTVNEFIREYRLKRAAQLLRDSTYNISDVMYMVGFNHPSYFTKMFKEMFKATPKEYRNKHKEEVNG